MIPVDRFAEIASWHEAGAAKTRAQTADNTGGASRNECVCPSPLDRSPGTCGWCLHRAALVADFDTAHPTLARTGDA